jgi:DNA invertase Pin-like site-specific DNA recombinase
MKTVAYLWVSTGGQDVATQTLAILDYAQRHRFTVALFVEAQLSSRRARQRE